MDAGRSRPGFEQAIIDDLAWLGLAWAGPVVRQSARGAAYAAALDELRVMGFVYPCFCTRREIAAEIAGAGAAPHGPEGPVYPGTCRGLDPNAAADRVAAGEGYALRLNVSEAARMAGDLTWLDAARGVVQAKPQRFGDIVLARKDAPAAYHLAVVVDDAAQGVSCVTRGEDLFEATDAQRLLQALLGLPRPEYAHHRLVLNQDGKRLAKRDRAETIAAWRDAGRAPEDALLAAGAAP